MDLTYTSDKIRYDKIAEALQNVSDVKAGEMTEDDLWQIDDLTKATAYQESGEITVEYGEVWNQNCLDALFQKPEYKPLQNKPNEFFKKFLTERFSKIAKAAGLEIGEYTIKRSDPDYGGEFLMKIEMYKANDDPQMDELINELSPVRDIRVNRDSEQIVNPQGQMVNTLVSPDNRFNQVYMPSHESTDPKLVDRLLKTLFDEKFDTKYTLSTDVGDWHPVKTLSTPEGKTFIQWEHEETTKVIIQTTFFKDDTNKITVNVTNAVQEHLIDTTFEVYRIPTDTFLVERFFRKVYFSALKKFINTQVIKLEPFRRSFVFWKSTNPQFSYSFSEPRKNQIVLNLIGFIKTAQRPVLDDFFEQNNLRHKQGYLQTLLDAAEDAGIFDFNREGNEVMIVKGTNFKAFLEGRIRKF